MLRLRLAALILALAIALAPSQAKAGKVGGTMARYCLAGAGIGGLLGGAAGTIPYMSDHQAFDFTVGAGAGALGGSVAGLIFGIVDLATDQGEEVEARLPDSALFAFNTGTTTYLAWKTVF